MTEVQDTFVYLETMQIHNEDSLEEGHGQREVEKLEINVCRACLSGGPSLGTLPRALRGTYWSLCDARDAASARPALCALCRRLLHNAHRFREQCRAADALIRQLHDNNQLSSEKISDEIRISLNPQSHLTIIHNVVESYNLELKHESDDEVTEVVEHGSLTKQEPEEAKNVPETANLLEIDKKNQPCPTDENDDDNINDSDFNVVMIASPDIKLSDTENNEDNVSLAKISNPKKNISNLQEKVIAKRKRNTKTMKKSTTKRKRKADSLKISTVKRKKISEAPKVVTKSIAPRKKSSQQNIETQNNNINLKKYMNVTTLTLSEQTNALMQKKESVAYQKAEYKCEVCFRTFGVKSGYDSHMFRHTDKFGQYRCAVCQLHFQYKNKLSTHMKIHKYIYNCVECSFKSNFRNSAIAHIASHEGKKYTCSICSMTFDHRSTYLCHVRRLHPSSHQCQLCGNTFISENGLKIHKLMVHRVDDVNIPSDGPLCAQCNTRFIDEAAFRKHIQVTTCAANYPKSALRKTYPKRRHTKCEVCGKEFRTFPEYEQHFMQEHPTHTSVQKRARTGTLCDQCGKIFHCVSVLEDHMSMHSAGGEKTFKCHQCGRSYLTKVRLKLHQIVHSGLRYPCQICGKEFTLQCNRDRHFKYVHTAEKNIKCKYCEKMFKSIEHKNSHEAFVHLNRPYPKRDRKKERERKRKYSRETEEED